MHLFLAGTVWIRMFGVTCLCLNVNMFSKKNKLTLKAFYNLSSN